MKHGLDHVKYFLDAHVSGYQSLQVVHIAGTNGKGSVTQMVSQTLTYAGYRVGTFMSPHLMDVTERVSCDGVSIARGDLDRLLGVVFGQSDHVFSFFEMIFLVSVMYFIEQGVDYVVYEVGLGGRYDATNVWTRPVATAVTSIGYDHQHILGNSLRQIQWNKMGVMKSGSPCFTRIDNRWMCGYARRVGAELHVVSQTASTSLLGAHQQENAGIAHAILQYLGLDDQQIEYGLQYVTHLGRCQYLLPHVLLDCGHNMQGRRALSEYVETVRDQYDEVRVIFGTTKGRDYLEQWSDTLVVAEKYYLVCPSISRGVEPREYGDVLEGDVSEISLAEIKPLVQCDDGVLWVIYGSLYLVADVLGMNWGE